MKDYSNFEYHPIKDFLKENAGDFFGALCFALICYLACMVAYIFE